MPIESMSTDDTTEAPPAEAVQPAAQPQIAQPGQRMARGPGVRPMVPRRGQRASGTSGTPRIMAADTGPESADIGGTK